MENQSVNMLLGLSHLSESVYTGQLSREQMNLTLKKGRHWLCEVIRWYYQVEMPAEWQFCQDLRSRCLLSLPRNCLALAFLPFPLSYCSHTSERKSDSEVVREAFGNTIVQRNLICFWLQLKSWRSFLYQDSIVNLQLFL